MSKIERSTNIELCRILAMIMIIGLHYFLYAHHGQIDSMNRRSVLVYHLFESFCIYGVDIFIIISSWFYVKIRSIKIKKILYLISLVFVWGLIDWLLGVVYYHQEHTLTSMIKAVIPYFWGGKWFVTAYFIYLCFIPFLSIGIAQLSNKSLFCLVVVMTFLYCFWPSFMPNPPIDDYGYGFMNFFYIYVLISYLKRVSFVLSSRLAISLLIISFLFTFGGAKIGFPTCWAYNNPFVIIGAYAIFSLFLQANVSHSLFINSISACTFGVFLIHTGPSFSRFIYGDLFKADVVFQNTNPILLVLNFLLCIFIFYIISVLLERIRLSIGKSLNISDFLPNIIID